MSRIRHTHASQESYDLITASAAAGERLIEQGYSPERALGVAAVVSRVLEEDIRVRSMHHREIGNPEFDHTESSSCTVEAGLSWLFQPELSEPYGLELGHVVNMHAGHSGEPMSPNEAAKSLRSAHYSAIDNLAQSGFNLNVKSEPLPYYSVRSARFSDNRNMALGSVKRPVADISRGNIRVETHMRASFGFMSDKNEIELEEVRNILEMYEDNDLLNLTLPSEDMDGGRIAVFPATVTLIGLRRARKPDTSKY